MQAMGCNFLCLRICRRQQSNQQNSQCRFHKSSITGKKRNKQFVEAGMLIFF
jgi:hypothetical protein